MQTSVSNPLGLNMIPDPAGILIHNGLDPETVYNFPSDNSSFFYPSYPFSDWLFTMKPGLFGLFGGIANPTGVALLVILTVMVISSMKWVRKGGYFEVRTMTVTIILLGGLLLLPMVGLNKWVKLL